MISSPRFILSLLYKRKNLSERMKHKMKSKISGHGHHSSFIEAPQAPLERKKNVMWPWIVSFKRNFLQNKRELCPRAFISFFLLVGSSLSCFGEENSLLNMKEEASCVLNSLSINTRRLQPVFHCWWTEDEDGGFYSFMTSSF